MITGAQIRKARKLLGWSPLKLVPHGLKYIRPFFVEPSAWKVSPRSLAISTR
jgi:hypothetical protein